MYVICLYLSMVCMQVEVEQELHLKLTCARVIEDSGQGAKRHNGIVDVTSCACT